MLTSGILSSSALVSYFLNCLSGTILLLLISIFQITSRFHIGQWAKTKQDAVLCQACQVVAVVGRQTTLCLVVC